MELLSFFRKLFFVSMFTQLVIFPSSATEIVEEEGSTFSIGVGVFYNDLPYTDWDGEDFSPVPLITYKTGNFYIEGTDIGYTILSEDNNDAGYYVDVLATARIGFGYESDDSPVLRGMSNRDDIAVEAGLKAGIYNQFGLLEVSAKQDIAGSHEGFIANVTYSLPLQTEDESVQFIPYVGASYQSDNFNDYYYGVKRREATADRAAYKGESGVNYFVGASAVYQFDKHWSVSLNAQYEKLDSSIEDSPIVSEDDMVSGFIGLNYTF